MAKNHPIQFFIHIAFFGNIYAEGVIDHEKHETDRNSKADEALRADSAMGAAVDHALGGGVADYFAQRLSRRSFASRASIFGLRGVHRRFAGFVGCHRGCYRFDPARRKVVQTKNAPKGVQRTPLGANFKFYINYIKER